TLRTEAGDSGIEIRRARLREPTGSPAARWLSTIWRKISRERSLSATRLGWPDLSGTSCATKILFPDCSDPKVVHLRRKVQAEPSGSHFRRRNGIYCALDRAHILVGEPGYAQTMAWN